MRRPSEGRPGGVIRPWGRAQPPWALGAVNRPMEDTSLCLELVQRDKYILKKKSVSLRLIQYIQRNTIWKRAPCTHVLAQPARAALGWLPALGLGGAIHQARSWPPPPAGSDLNSCAHNRHRNAAASAPSARPGESFLSSAHAQEVRDKSRGSLCLPASRGLRSAARALAIALSSQRSGDHSK